MRRAGDSLRAIAAAMTAEGFQLSHFVVDKIISAAAPKPKQAAKSGEAGAT
jgi:hypothetical protein